VLRLLADTCAATAGSPAQHASYTFAFERLIAFERLRYGVGGFICHVKRPYAYDASQVQQLVQQCVVGVHSQDA
jgi:hypothetical protein